MYFGDVACQTDEGVPCENCSCVHIPGEHGKRRSRHQRVPVLHPGHQSTVAGRETRCFWQSPGRDGG